MILIYDGLSNPCIVDELKKKVNKGVCSCYEIYEFL